MRPARISATISSTGETGTGVRGDVMEGAFLGACAARAMQVPRARLPEPKNMRCSAAAKGAGTAQRMKF